MAYFSLSAATMMVMNRFTRTSSSLIAVLTCLSLAGQALAQATAAGTPPVVPVAPTAIPATTANVSVGTSASTVSTSPYGPTTPVVVQPQYTQPYQPYQPYQPNPQYGPYVPYPNTMTNQFQPQMMPPTKPYQEGEQAPAGYRLEEQYRKGLLIAGSVVLGSGYLTTALFALIEDGANKTTGMWPVYIPVIGPFISMATRKDTCKTYSSYGGSTSSYCSHDTSSYNGLSLVTGLIQATGFALLIPGLSKRKIWIRNDIAKNSQPEKGFGKSWIATPTVFGDKGAGVSVSGVLF